MNLFNINPNYNFLQSLALFISQNFANQEGELLLILPSKKSCLEFKKTYKLLINPQENLKVTSISEISPSNLQFISKNIQIDQKTYDIFKKQPNDLRYSFELAKKIQNTPFFRNANLTSSINIATSLKNLFDDLSKADIKVEDLQIDDYNISNHRQFAINIIKEFYIDFKSNSFKNESLTSSDIQKLKIKHISQLLEKHGFDKKVIIAGSTGSIEYVRDFMKIIASNQNGYVITNGSYSRSKEINPQDPAFLFNDLFSHLDIKSNQITQIIFQEAKISNDERFNMLANNVLSYEVNKINSKDQEMIKQDFNSNFQIFKAKNQINEVKIISNYLKSQDLSNKKTAIICPNINLMILLKNFLQKNNLQFNDYEKSSLVDLKFIKLFLLVAKALQNDMDSVSILALLKSDLTNDQENLNLVYKFEKQIIRIYKSSNDIENLLKTIQENHDFSHINHILGDIYSIYKNINRLNISQIFHQISSLICKFSKQELDQFFNIEQFEKINQISIYLQENQDLKITKNEISEFFSKIFSFASFSKEVNEGYQIEISNTIESRLINYDILIFIGLNKANYPDLEKDSWLSGKIRKELKIFNNDKKTSLAAYDFCNLLCNKQVILSYSDFINGSKAGKSQFLLKLETILHKIDVDISNDLSLENQELQQIQIVKNSPQIKLENYLKSFTATDIDLITGNPYSFYAKRILKLKPEKEIDQGPTNADFGTFMHKLVEICAKENLDEENAQKELSSLFFAFFKCQESRLTYLPKAQKILQNFLKINQEFLEKESFYEQNLSKKFANKFLLNAKIDRIHIDEIGHKTIIDYKTGAIPKAKDVKSHKSPQLLIYALLSENVNSIKYWKLSTNPDESIANILDGEKLTNSIEQISENLTKLMGYFSENLVSFNVIENDNKYDDYRHLSRISK